MAGTSVLKEFIYSQSKIIQHIYEQYIANQKWPQKFRKKKKQANMNKAKNQVNVLN